MTEQNGFHVEQNDDIAIVSLGKKYESLEGVLVEETEKSLMEIAQKQGCTHLILDMEQTRYFGSAFIESLVRVWNELKSRKQGSLKLCSVQSYCREVLEVTHLDEIWGICDTREHALEQCH